MTDLKLTIDFSERVERCFKMLSDALSGWRMDITPAQPADVQTVEDNPQPAQPSAPEAAPAPAEEPFNAALESRRIIDATRARLLTTPELKEAFGRQLTQTFRDISTKLGASKPSLLTTREQMRQFEELCAKIDHNGTHLFTPDNPF